MFEEIDSTIQSVERLYRTVSGKEAEALEQPYAPIPPEHDASKHVEDQVERLLNTLSRVQLGGTAETPQWFPPVSVWERPDEVLICIDLPGVPKDALAVSANGNLLMVSGRRPLPS